MSAFVLRFDLSNHRHPENSAAQHQKVCEWLRLVVQAVGSNPARSGEIDIPVFDPTSNMGRREIIGTWEFIEEDANPSSTKAA